MRISKRTLTALAPLAATLVTAGLALAEPEAARPTAPQPTAQPTAQPAPAASGKGLTANIPCSACHTTTGWKAKDAKGEAGGFDHATTGFPLSGQHVKATCVSCHDGKRALKRACASCHTDEHRGRLSQSCDNCHVPAGWRVTKPLEIHRFTRFPLTGMHVLTDCTQCHQRANDHQWTGAPIYCFACHEKDYRRPNLRPVHTGSATTAPFPRDCSQCHQSMSWVPARFDPALVTGSASAALKTAPAGHDLRFPISFGSHRGATCDDCHAQAAVPRMVRCNGCHAHDTLTLVQRHKQPVSSLGSACLSCHPGGARR